MTDDQLRAAKALVARLEARDPGLKEHMALMLDAVARLDGTPGAVVRAIVADVPEREVARRLGLSLFRVYGLRRAALATARRLVRTYEQTGRWPDGTGEPVPPSLWRHLPAATGDTGPSPNGRNGE